jgi:hypothetical protein
MRALALSLALGSAVVLPACRMNERLSGTIMGGVGGAALGGLATGSFGGVVVGAGIGALAGYLVGDYIADQRERGVNSSNRWSGSATDVLVVNGEARDAYERGRRAATAEEARAAYEESARLDPTRPEPYNALGVSMLASGDRDAARAWFRRSLDADPAYGPARHNLDRLDRTL